jgi:hypothetical protein
MHSKPGQDDDQPLTDQHSDSRVAFPRAAVIVVVVAALVQLAVGALGPLDGDETLYWEWSRHLAWGYFDHPPGVALLVHLGTALFGVSALGVRCITVLANLGGALIVVTLARRHGNERVALIAALVISSLPIMANWLMLATPDPGLFVTSMAVLLLVDNALREERGSSASLRWWLLAGVALGLAALAKELAVLVPMGIVAACLTHRELRPRLAEAGPYLAALVAAGVVLPLVLWNRDHNWVFLQFLLHRGLGAESSGVAARELELIGGQVALVSPLLFGLLAIAVFRTLQHDRAARRHLLAVSSLVTFGWFVVVALRHAVEPNWVMMAWPPAVVLLAVGAKDWVSRRVFNVALAVGAAMVLVLYIHTAVPVLPLSPLHDPIRRGHGWSDVALRVDAARTAVGTRATWIAGNRFQDASQLAFYLPGHPFVFSLNIQSRANQYDLWPGFANDAKVGDGLIVLLDDVVEDTVAHTLAPYFDRVSPGEQVVGGGARPALVPKRIWVFEGWRGGWPAR